MTDFEERNRLLTDAMATDESLQASSREWFNRSHKYEYSYHFNWLGRPVIQLPQDVVAVQEVIWAVKPQLIVETGIARGGSLILSASILELIGERGIVVGIDVDIRHPNRIAIEGHPLANRIEMIDGSSTDPDVARRVSQLASGLDRIIVILDSNHTRDHVRQEMELYSPLVGPGGYLIVFDTVIALMEPGSFGDRPWDETNNPASAVADFLVANDRFEVDADIDRKLLISAAPGGYLKCIKA